MATKKITKKKSESLKGRSAVFYGVYHKKIGFGDNFNTSLKIARDNHNYAMEMMAKINGIPINELHAEAGISLVKVKLSIIEEVK